MEEDFDFFDGLLEETGGASASSPATVAVAATQEAHSSVLLSSSSPFTPAVELFNTPSPPLRRRSTEERFNELVQLKDVDPEQKCEVIPLAKSLVVQYRAEPHFLYVTRKSVFIPHNSSTEYFQSPNFRHLVHMRLRKCSEDMANATGLAFTEHEQQQHQNKRQRRVAEKKKQRVFDLAMQNTLKIVYGGGTI